MRCLTMLGIFSVVFCGVSLQAQTAEQSTLLGVWNGTLEGQPGVTLTLAEDHGQLGGTIVFNLILGREPNAHVGRQDAALLTNARLEGDTLSFQVTRRSDAHVLQMAVKSIDRDRLELQCPDCGDGPPMTLVKLRP